jgi:hypothetical protein
MSTRTVWAKPEIVERQAPRRVLPAHVIGEALDRFAITAALEALEDDDHRHDERRDRTAPDVGEQIVE